MQVPDPRDANTGNLQLGLSVYMYFFTIYILTTDRCAIPHTYYSADMVLRGVPDAFARLRRRPSKLSFSLSMSLYCSCQLPRTQLHITMLLKPAHQLTAKALGLRRGR